MSRERPRVQCRELPTFCPDPKDRRLVWDAAQRSRRVPDGWVHVPPGDAALTRRLKSAGPDSCWMLEELRGRKRFGRGVFAPGSDVERVRADLVAERADPAYARKQQVAKERRDRKQLEYVRAFRSNVLEYLDFPLQHHELAERLAARVVAHATPVGSGTVARTQRISIERRAEAAVVAWLRHATTAYDGMRIPRAKGSRREVRRMLAQRSCELLDRYRRAEISIGEACPLRDALQSA